MRRVFSNHSEVCHVWAQQKQSQGKSGNIFFDGVSIYSYGRHFEMARFIDEETVFITSRGYSVSTAKHLSLVRGAVQHKTVYTVPQFTYHPDNVRYFIEKARDHFDKAKRARKYQDWEIQSGREAVETTRAYITKFQVPVPESHVELWQALHTDTYLNGEVQAQLLAKAKAAQAAEREEQKQRRLERERKEAEQLEKWMLGTLPYGRFSAMRLRVHEDEVQTTHGASVPLIEARKLYRALKAGVDVAGQRVGYYTITRVTAGELVVGCHMIPLSEVERIAPEVMSKLLVEA
jgi:hypothetical protein